VKTFRVQCVTLLEIFNLETSILLLKPLFDFWKFPFFFLEYFILFCFGNFYRLVGLWKLWRLLASLDQKFILFLFGTPPQRLHSNLLACLRFAILTLCSCWVMPTWATNKISLISLFVWNYSSMDVILNVQHSSLWHELL
jgi:hypothetical protein